MHLGRKRLCAFSVLENAACLSLLGLSQRLFLKTVKEADLACGTSGPLSDWLMAYCHFPSASGSCIVVCMVSSGLFTGRLLCSWSIGYAARVTAWIRVLTWVHARACCKFLKSRPLSPSLRSMYMCIFTSLSMGIEFQTGDKWLRCLFDISEQT